ncbi:hypothetical protein PspLS_07187 [Pyricularia sp. CBS 133598]|nr:hypothetical protein PspLS_07187 [Pyricularia sp. CBS 133598]
MHYPEVGACGLDAVANSNIYRQFQHNLEGSMLWQGRHIVFILASSDSPRRRKTRCWINKGLTREA